MDTSHVGHNDLNSNGSKIDISLVKCHVQRLCP